MKTVGRVGVVNYQAGNIRSVETALRQLQAEFFVSDKPEELCDADRLIFPGVGEAQAAMSVLTDFGLGEAIKAFFRSGKPLLGICIGSQIIMESSEERNTRCLGLLAGTAALPVQRDPRWIELLLRAFLLPKPRQQRGCIGKDRIRDSHPLGCRLGQSCRRAVSS